MTRRRQRGASVAEALVAAALAGTALAGLASVARLTVVGLRSARDTSTALALASERLETLRATPRVAGSDSRTAPDGTLFTSAWRTAGGRGVPAGLDVRIDWRGGTLALGSEAFP
jgi:Tfp pilus assembly protein PilV